MWRRHAARRCGHVAIGETALQKAARAQSFRRIPCDGVAALRAGASPRHGKSPSRRASSVPEAKPAKSYMIRCTCIELPCSAEAVVGQVANLTLILGEVTLAV